MKTKTKTGETTIEVSAPGQIFLFGEHAVVYGQAALSTSIDLRTRVKSEPLENNKIEIKSEKIGRLEGRVEKKDGNRRIIDKKGKIEELQFVTRALELTFEYLGKSEGLSLDIDSDIPIGSGLGSSSAVTTGTVAAVSSVLDEKLDKGEIADIAYRTEVDVQGAASRSGVNVASFGGFLRVQEEEMERLEKLPKLNVIIGYSREYGNTGELVEKVRLLRESRPKLINPIILAIGSASEVGIRSLREKNLKKVGALMNANQNLLEGLDVSTPKLRNMIQRAIDSNALGAKITGAGGGGCMITLAKNNSKQIKEAIKQAGGEPIETKIGGEGIKY